MFIRCVLFPSSASLCTGMMYLGKAGKVVNKKLDICMTTLRGTGAGPAAPVMALTHWHCLSCRRGAAVPPTTHSHPAGIPLTGCIIFILVRAGDDVNALSGSQQLAYTCNSVIAPPPPQDLKASLEGGEGREGRRGMHTSGVVFCPAGSEHYLLNLRIKIRLSFYIKNTYVIELSE